MLPCDNSPIWFTCFSLLAFIINTFGEYPMPEQTEDVLELDRQIAEANLKRDQRLAKIKADLISQLSERGVVRVEVEYDGSGDEGFVESIAAFTIEGTKVELSDESRDLIDQYTYEGIPYDWYNNEGGYGTMRIDVAKEAFFVEHNQRYIAVSPHEWEA